MSRYLALDLGTTTGFAVGGAGAIVSGIWDLKPKRFEGGGMRFVYLRKHLNELRDAYNPSMVLFEEVRRHRGVDAAHVYGGLMAVVTEWCEENKIPYAGFPVGEIKKAWTGKGNASKDEMVAEALRRGVVVQTDDQADALAVLHLAIERFGASGQKEAA